METIPLFIIYKNEIDDNINEVKSVPYSYHLSQDSALKAFEDDTRNKKLNRDEYRYLSESEFIKFQSNICNNVLNYYNYGRINTVPLYYIEETFAHK